MKIEVDTEKAEVRVEEDGHSRVYGLGTAEGFAAVSRAWLRSGWDAKYVYSFTWMGRPIIQLPDDMIRLQELIYRVKPDVLIETGVAHGGSLVFYASLFKAMDRGRVIGVDIEIRPHNRKAIESHEMYPLISLIEGSSVAPGTVQKVQELIKPGERVMVLLDSNHTKEHVAAELEAYAPLVAHDSYLVAMDGIMEFVPGAPRSRPDWIWNNPRQAAIEFARKDSRFVLEEPAFAFNEGMVRERVTYWPDAFLRRVK